MMINTLFIIDAVVFDEDQNAYFNNLTARWYVIRNNGTRQLIDAVIDENKFAEAEAALAQWNPNVIGKWKKDGSLITKSVIDNTDPANPIHRAEPELYDTTEYIALLPPIITVNPDDTFTETPRTEAVDVHRFAGWEARQWA